MPSIQYGLFCDDIRREAGGRTSVMGIWGRQIFIQGEPPGRMRLAFHAYVLDVEQDQPFTMELTGPGIDEPATANGTLAAGAATPLGGHNLNWLIGDVLVPEPAEFVVRVILAGEPPVDREFRLEVGFRAVPEEQGAAPG